MRSLLFFLTVAAGFYIVEYCQDEAIHGFVSLVHHLKRFEDAKEALEFINANGACHNMFICQPARNFELLGLYNTTRMELKKVPTAAKRVVQVQKEEDYIVEKFEL